MSTSKNTFLFALAISISSTTPLCAQITGNLHVRDPKALAIGPEQTALLVDKRWNCRNMIDRRREVVEERQPWDNTARFVSTGEYKDARTKPGSGSWEIVNNQFIKISVTPSRPDAKNLLHGAYSICEISDSTLVLTQVFTSSGDWVREFRFTTAEVTTQPKGDGCRDQVTVPATLTENSMPSNGRGHSQIPSEPNLRDSAHIEVRTHLN